MSKIQNMKKISILLVLFTASLTGYNKPVNMVKDAEWMKERLATGNLVVFHIGRAEDFEKEHIPDAVFIDGQDYTWGDDTHVFDLPPLDKFEKFLEVSGISNDTEIVIYAATSWVPMVTRLYFTLDYLGMGNKTYILDGGLVAWKAINGEVTDEVSKPRKGKFTPSINESLIVDKDYMKKAVEKKSTIVDCRASVYYQGIEMNKMHGGRKGRIPGSKTIPYTSLTIKSSGMVKFKKLQQLEEIFKAQGLQKDDEILLYCHIGMQLTVVYTAAKMLGYEDVKIYDGSFHEWGPDESLPVELE